MYAYYTIILYIIYFIYVDETYSLKSNLNDRFLTNFFMAGLFHAQSFYQISTERKSPMIYSFLVRFTGDEL